MSTRTQKEKLILLATLCLLSAKSCNGSKLGRSEHEKHLPPPNPGQTTAIVSVKGEKKMPEATPAQKNNKQPNATAISISTNDTTEAEAEATSAEQDKPKTESEPTKRGIASRLPFMNKKN
ncbi:MAG: hypothetical protein NQ127_02255 [Candidatus Cardinium sp.]|nr:hypothetical protein [Candidatus Cardinium sp.]